MKRRTKYVVSAMAAVWIIAMMTLIPEFVSAHRQTNAVKESFDDFAQALVNQEFQKAYDYYCGPQFREATSLDEFVATQQNLEARYGRLKAVKRGAYEVHGKGKPMYWRAVISADLVFEKQTLRYEFVFHDDGKGWTLYGYEQL